MCICMCICIVCKSNKTWVCNGTEEARDLLQCFEARPNETIGLGRDTGPIDAQGIPWTLRTTIPRPLPLTLIRMMATIHLGSDGPRDLLLVVVLLITL